MTPADLRAVRARHDVTQAQLAKAIGVGVNRIVDLEAGRVRSRKAGEADKVIEEIPQTIALAVEGWVARQHLRAARGNAEPQGPAMDAALAEERQALIAAKGGK